MFLIPWLKNLLGVTNISFADALVASAGAVLPLFGPSGANRTQARLLLESGFLF